MSNDKDIRPPYLQNPEAMKSAAMATINVLASLMGTIGGNLPSSLRIPVPSEDTEHPYWKPIATNIFIAAAIAVEAPIRDKEHAEAEAVTTLKRELIDIFATEGVKRDDLDAVMSDEFTIQNMKLAIEMICDHLKELRRIDRERREGPEEL